MSDPLPAYFARIGIAAPREPGLAALRAIVAAHAAAIPFENIDVLLGRGARLDLGALVDKLVARRRGGYCFEHNTLLREVLARLGFAVAGLAARVVWQRPPDSPLPRTHMLLRVTLAEGVFLADVGFGGLTMTAPLRMATDLEQQTPHEPHRLVARGGDEWELQARLDGDWAPLYRFTQQVQLPVDYEVANWFTATYPASLFTDNLMCARPDADCRYALFNDRLTIRRRGRPAERRALVDAGDLAAILERDFHVTIARDDAERVWARIAGRG